MNDIDKTVTEVIEKLCNTPMGNNLGVFVWKNGQISTNIISGYGGEQDGDNPIAIFSRDDYGCPDEETGEMIAEYEIDNAGWRDKIQEEIEDGFNEVMKNVQ